LLDVLPQINDAGQIAFSYELIDGRTGIARADPTTAVPEPALLACFASGLLFVTYTQVKRRRRPRG